MSSASRKHARYQQQTQHRWQPSQQSSRSRFTLLQQGTEARVRQPAFTTNREEEAIQVAVCAADKAYFASHPGETEYVRRMVKGQVPRTQIHPEKHYMVKVTYHNPDMRTRSFFEVPAGDMEQTAA